MLEEHYFKGRRPMNTPFGDGGASKFYLKYLLFLPFYQLEIIKKVDKILSNV